MKKELSGRERQVIALLAEGHRVKGVAKLLDRSEKTISTHVARVKEKLSIRDHVEWFQYLKNWKGVNQNGEEVQRSEANSSSDVLS